MEVKGKPRDGLIGATLGFFIGFAAVALFGPTANKLNDILHLTPVAIGFLVAMPSLSGSLLRIPFAAWVDTAGGRKPFLILLGLSIIGMAGLTLLMFLRYPAGITPGLLPVLFLLGILCGCGIATFSVGTAQVAYWFPRRAQGSALGTYAGVGNLAPGIFSFLLPIALAGLGIAGSYLVWLIFLVIGTVLYYLLGRNAPYFQLKLKGYTDEQARTNAAGHGQEIFPSGRLKDSLLRSARTSKTWLLVVIYFTTFGGFLALTAWLPIYWKSFFGIPAVTAGALTALYSILASLCRVAGGSVSDQLGGEKTLMLALSTIALGAVLMAISAQSGLSIGAEILMAIGMGVSNAAVFKLVPQAVPQAVGGASGWVGGLGAFGGFTIPPILGAIAVSRGAAGYREGFVLFIGLTLLSLALAYAFKRRPDAVPQPQPVPKIQG
jgi:MFS transporter, NNP family, nitrate/nitrite transporter